MHPYRITIPTKVYFGRNIWRKALAEQEPFLQGKTMIVTTGRSLERLGYVDEVCLELQKYNQVKQVTIFDHVSANPKLSEIQEGIERGRQDQINLIVGFGGGSAVDAAKAIAAGVRADEDIRTIFYEEKEPGNNTLPIIAMPTTAGTGSELSKAAIITDERRKIKSGIRGSALFPRIAIVDSFFTESVPLQTTMETGFDVLAHAIESFISKAASPYTRMQSETAVRIVGKYLPRLTACLSDIEAREQMSYASMIMGINLANASTCLPHRLQYPIGAHTDTSHGAGLAALFPAWITCEYQYAPEAVENMMSLLGGVTVCGEKPCTAAMRRFIETLGLEVSLQEMGIEEEQLSVMSGEVSGNMQNDPAAQEAGIVHRLYEMAWQEGERCRQS